MDKFEKHISDQLQNDKLNFSADTAIHNRLMYHMELKSVKSAVRRNAVLPSIGFLLTSKYVGIKVGIAALLLISFMGYKQMNMNNSFIQLSDTAQVIHNLDTLNYNIKDSLLAN